MCIIYQLIVPLLLYRCSAVSVFIMAPFQSRTTVMHVSCCHCWSLKNTMCSSMVLTKLKAVEGCFRLEKKNEHSSNLLTVLNRKASLMPNF